MADGSIDTDPRAFTIAGRYVLGERLGGGGMAVVDRAYDTRLQREVAVKLLDLRRGSDREARVRFETEARAAASINHPRVVAVHDVGVENDLLYIVMECLPGGSLATELRNGPVRSDRVHEVLADVLAGLGAAHEKGVLHRDIKPSNVLVDSDGHVKLADFGIATTGDADLTATGIVVGTAAYLAPERIAGGRATVSSDLYAVGVLGYELLTGERPYVGDTPVALAHAIHEGTHRPLRELRPDAPVALAAALTRAMDPDPAARPASAAEFAHQLDDATPTMRAPTVAAPRTERIPVTAADPVATDPVVARPAHTTPSTAARRRVWTWVAVVILAAIAIGLIVGMVWSSARRDSGSGSGSSPTVTSTPPPSVPAPLQSPFDRLQHAVQP